MIVDDDDTGSKFSIYKILITSIVAIVTSVVGAIVTIQVAKISTAVSKVAATTEKIHVATNSGRTEILRLVLAQSKRIAETSKDPDDIKDYERAKADLAAAEEAQKSLENKQ